MIPLVQSFGSRHSKYKSMGTIPPMTESVADISPWLKGFYMSGLCVLTEKNRNYLLSLIADILIPGATKKG